MLVLLLCLLVLLIPGGTTAGEFELIGSPDPIVAVVGDKIILPCSLQPPINAQFLTVKWTRPDQEHIPVLVHLYSKGRNLNSLQNASYKDRTMLFEGELVQGNVSLKLLEVKLEDEGSYTCRVVKDSQEKETVIHLSVGMVSIPVVSILAVYDTGLVLQCVAKSWYPEPEVEWRESKGQLLHADVTQTDKDPDGRYTVRSKVTVQKTDTNMFTCRVELQGLNQTRETEILVPGKQVDRDEPQSSVQMLPGKQVDRDEPQSSVQMPPERESQVSNGRRGSDSGAGSECDEDSFD
ncbi:butyrophilin subfamily 1 member A1-like isoform X2 [Osmerus mordax]|uniref:butyrophilin subfamily 1 member A1-like isoform X2 n=1 Tax=Osmerus mordax TaxID=8014 RepID=UPI00350EFD45